ncbi:MAG: (Fe-S)-binding protein [Desulfobacterium sp.]|nr:(Fe-S)-binding protein [Desulfobacterium sp.]MBU3948014.1 hypothetical protein [Pseudomonadota bacterium]MBU4037056.1 hypothetical protein [Pseudomonadota bacterium]
MHKRNVKYSKEFAEFIEYLAAGRSLEEQVDDCWKTGNHSIPSVLRTGVLRNIGVKEANPKSENFIVWSCYVPFWSTNKLRDTVKIVNALGIDYNYSDKEVCCGAPMVQDSREIIGISEERKKEMDAQAHKMRQFNVDLAEKSGQKIMVYACQVCAAVVKRSFPDEPERHRFIYDLIMDKMENMDLKIEPTTIGFFEGCHKFYPHNSNLDWKRYRKLLGTVEGLEIIDLPRKICCKQDANAILENAEKNNLTQIVAPDGDCHYFLRSAAAVRGGKVEIKNLPEVLLVVLGK